MDDKTRVVNALHEVGVQAQTIWDLVNSGATYRNAIPALLDLLPSIGDRKVKEGIVRALTVPEARKLATMPLIAEMRASGGDETLGWAIGNALSVVVTPEDEAFDDLAALLRDKKLGRARQMLPEALARTKDSRALGVLLEVLSQEEITGHVLHALGKLQKSEAYPQIERYLTHPNAWIKREARNALKRIDHAKG